ncbi:MAG: LytTR family DNA-binding domain-containing protein [Eubacteriaceae bacterium]|nr:LytTR family DNA-binding domain-containing protein [Eubacteriaceae bacterium]
MKIAVCDDNASDLLALKTKIKQAAPADALVKIAAFSCADALLTAVRDSGFFDCYFLDILLKDDNGIELGKTVRRLNPDASIIYITSSPEFALEAFGVQAMDYLIKPVEEEKLAADLKRVMRIAARSGEVFALKVPGGVTRVAVDQISYAENVDRCVNLILKDSRRVVGSTSRFSFEKMIADLLVNTQFIQIHKSYAVNMAAIQTIEGEKVIMDDGHCR